MRRVKWEAIAAFVGVAAIAVAILQPLPGGLSQSALALVGIGLLVIAALGAVFLGTPLGDWIGAKLRPSSDRNIGQVRATAETLLAELMPFVDEWEKAQGKPVLDGDLLYGYRKLGSYADKYAADFAERVERTRRGFRRAGRHDRELDDYSGEVTNPIAAKSVANGIRRLIDLSSPGPLPYSIYR
jgi:hypothetical protein